MCLAKVCKAEEAIEDRLQQGQDGFSEQDALPSRGDGRLGTQRTSQPAGMRRPGHRAPCWAGALPKQTRLASVCPV